MANITNTSIKRQLILQNVDNIESEKWSQLLPVLQSIGFDIVQKFTIDYIENCDDKKISKIYSTTLAIDMLLSSDVLSYSLQFLSLNERMRLSILSKSFANLMQSNAIWNDARVHVYPSDKQQNKNLRKIQIDYNSTESPCVMVPSSLFGMDNFKFLNIIEYLCVNVHEWNYINMNTWNELQKNMKYLYITHNDRFTPSFDFLESNYKSLMYLRVDFSINYQGVISLQLPSNLKALCISCLSTNIHSWSYLAQSMISMREETIGNIDNSDIVLFPFGNPNKETILSMNVFMQQKFEQIKFLKLSDCTFKHKYEIQNILDSCKKLQYLSLIRVRHDDDEQIDDIMIPSNVVGLCFINSGFNIDLSKCGRNTLWEISIDIKSLTVAYKYGGTMLETQLLQHLRKYCKSLRQMILFGNISTQSLRIITSNFNEIQHKMRFVISDKEDGMNRYWSKKFGVVFTRILNPNLCPNDYELLRGIKNKTTMFANPSTDKISWQYYTNQI